MSLSATMNDGSDGYCWSSALSAPVAIIMGVVRDNYLSPPRLSIIACRFERCGKGETGNENARIYCRTKSQTKPGQLLAALDGPARSRLRGSPSILSCLDSFNGKSMLS